MSSQYDDIIQKWSSYYGVPEALVRAVIQQESGFKSTAYNPSDPQGGAHGLMQILNGTAAWVAKLFGISYSDSQQLYDPETNVRIGTAYLSYQLKRYNGNIPDAVAAYNAGSARTKNGQFINQSYVDHVMSWFNSYSTTSNPPSTPVAGPSGRADGSGSGDGTDGGDPGKMIFLAGVGVIAALLIRRIL